MFLATPIVPCAGTASVFLSLLPSADKFTFLTFLHCTKTMTQIEASQGESVLFVSPASVNQDALAKAKASAQDQVGAAGATAFEALERVAEGEFCSFQ